jgi:predicted Fe-Mo cluster-binding NifX family protein
MKVAVPVTSNNQIEDHFGHCEFYNLYTISENNDILNVQTLESEQGCGCKSNIASVLKNEGVSVMLAGGIGGGAINVLNNAGIHVIRGCAGTPEDVVKQFIAGLITDSGLSCQKHEKHHGENHVCNH